MAIYLPTSIHLSNLTWSNAIIRIESNWIYNHLIQSNAISCNIYIIWTRENQKISVQWPHRGAEAVMLGRHAAHATGRSCRPEDHPRPKRKRPFAVGPQDICRRGCAGQCGTFQLDSVSTMGSGGSFIFRFSSLQSTITLITPTKII